MRKIKHWIYKQCYLQCLRYNSDEVVTRWFRIKINILITKDLTNLQIPFLFTTFADKNN